MPNSNDASVQPIDSSNGPYGALLLIAAAYAFSVVLDLSVAKVVLGVAMVGYVPGTLLVRLLFQAPGQLSSFERVVLGMVFSALLCSGLGLVLNLVPGGLRPSIVNAALCGLVALLFVLNYLTVGQKPGQRMPAGKHIDSLLERVKAQLRKGDLLPYFVAAVVATCCVAMLASLAVGVENEERYTEFYALNQNGIADSSLAVLPAGDTSSFVLGISNRTGATQSYQIEVIYPRGVLLRSDEIMVKGGDARQVPVSLQLPDDAAGTRLEVRLYLEGNTSPQYVLFLQVAE